MKLDYRVYRHALTCAGIYVGSVAAGVSIVVAAFSAAVLTNLIWWHDRPGKRRADV